MKNAQGDSGGPLIKKGNSPEDDVLVGLVSWGLGCADEVFPGGTCVGYLFPSLPLTLAASR